MFSQRQNAGDDPLAYADAVYRRHLHDPVPGVYAVDNELYRELVHAPALDRKRAIQEAERRRRSGQASRIIFETARIRNPELAR